MEVSETNLYTTGRIIIFKDGREKLVRTKLQLEPSKTDLYYEVKQGDVFDDIAQRFYKDQVEKAWTCWWIITDMNKVKNPLYIQLFIGKEIVIPNLQRVLLAIE